LESGEEYINKNRMNASTVYTSLARQLVDLFASLPQVKAIALGGSLVSGITDQSSDIDLYVYTQTDIPQEDRQEIVARSGGASQVNMGMTYWGSGDEWFNAPTGIEVDIVYFDAQWMESQIQRVIGKHEASLGYTTCLWHIVRNSQVMYDPQKWFQNLQKRASVEYPEPLRQNIITLNYPVLRDVIPAYANQLAKAVKRHDLISVNHRLAALLASYFDIIFALNRELHPGEKKLLNLAQARCTKLPVDLTADIAAVIHLSGTADETFLVNLTRLLDHLDQWLEQEGFNTPISHSRPVV
jgi:hypothetical protein